jgi:hypothetical protein
MAAIYAICRSKPRKATLGSLLRKPGALRLSEHIAPDGLRVFAHACRLGAEGIVSKRLGSSYRSGPCHAWIKCKNPESVAAQPDRAAHGRHQPQLRDCEAFPQLLRKLIEINPVQRVGFVAKGQFQTLATQQEVCRGGNGIGTVSKARRLLLWMGG